MPFIELVARWTTESCHMPIRLSMFEEKHYDNTQFSQKLRTENCRVYNIADQQCFPEYTVVKTKGNPLYLEFHLFFQCSCVSIKRESDCKMLKPTQHLPDIGCGTLPTTTLTFIKTDNA